MTTRTKEHHGLVIKAVKKMYSSYNIEVLYNKDVNKTDIYTTKTIFVYDKYNIQFAIELILKGGSTNGREHISFSY